MKSKKILSILTAAATALTIFSGIMPNVSYDWNKPLSVSAETADLNNTAASTETTVSGTEITTTPAVTAASQTTETTPVTSSSEKNTTYVTSVIPVTKATSITQASIPGYCFIEKNGGAFLKTNITENVTEKDTDIELELEIYELTHLITLNLPEDFELVKITDENGNEVSFDKNNSFNVTAGTKYILTVHVPESAEYGNSYYVSIDNITVHDSGNIIYLYSFGNGNIKMKDPNITTVTSTPASTTETTIIIVTSATMPPIYDGEGDSIKIVNMPDKLEYKIGEELDLTGLLIEITHYSTHYTPDGKLEQSSSTSGVINPLENSSSCRIDTSNFDNTKTGTYKIHLYSGGWLGWNYIEVTVIDDEVIITTETTQTTTETTATTSTTVSASTTTTANTTNEIDLPVIEFEVKGDANGDNELDVRDCAFIASKLAQNKGDELPKESDFNGDGKVNVRDAAAIAKFLALKLTK